MEEKVKLVVELSKEDYDFIKNLEPITYDYEGCDQVQVHILNSIKAAAKLNNGRCWKCKNVDDYSKSGLDKCGECKTYVHHSFYEPKE